jgi:hypothetical protein
VGERSNSVGEEGWAGKWLCRRGTSDPRGRIIMTTSYEGNGMSFDTTIVSGAGLGSAGMDAGTCPL